MANHHNTSWTPETLPAAQSQTRSAAALWLHIIRNDNQEYLNLLDLLKKCFDDQDKAAKTLASFASESDPANKNNVVALIKACYPLADIDQAEAMAKRQAPYEDVTDELVDEIIETTHTEGYEIIPWRESSLRILAIEFLANLKSSSAVLTEDAILRTTSLLDPKLRGTTKNACQLISGQRTKLRKTVRMLVLAALYHGQYRSNFTLEQVQADVMQLVKKCPDEDFIRDEFPFNGFFADNGSFNARGRFAFCEAIKFVRAMLPKREQLDELIQNSSKRWRISRMSLVDLNILRLATYELYFEHVSTPRILINEAVELAKIFGAEQSKNFVNGILQQLCNDNNITVA